MRGRRSRLRPAARHPESAIESTIRRTASRRGRERYVGGASRSAEDRALILQGRVRVIGERSLLVRQADATYETDVLSPEELNPPVMGAAVSSLSRGPLLSFSSWGRLELSFVGAAFRRTDRQAIRRLLGHAPNQSCEGASAVRHGAAALSLVQRRARRSGAARAAYCGQHTMSAAAGKDRRPLFACRTRDSACRS